MVSSRVLKWLGCALVCMTAFPAKQLHGQATVDLVQALKDARAASQYLRITGVDTFQGRVTYLSSDAVRVSGERVILTDIQRVEYRTRRAGGGVVGAAAGVLLLGGATALFLRSSSDSWGLGGVIVTGAVGIGVGIPIGMAVGKNVSPPKDTWHMLWLR